MLPIIYKRFIDDLFLMFTNQTEAEYFITCFNLVHPDIWSYRDLLISKRILKNVNKVAKSVPPLSLYVTYSTTINQIVCNNTLLPSSFIKQVEPDYYHMFNDKPRVICKNRRNLTSLFTSTTTTIANIDFVDILLNTARLHL